MVQRITIIGQNIRDITTFYKEINRVFMQSEDWKISESLDAFNDLLYGGFGSIMPDKDVEIVWHDIALSKAALGYDPTRSYYIDKLKPQSPFNKKYFENKLEELESGSGQTYFDIIIEVTALHPRIRLIKK
jgi:RNAse (barnase) inhibitor barstar